MTTEASYVKGAELADLIVAWQDSTGAAVDMSTGYTFSVKVGLRGAAATFTKTSGITGTATGCTVAWATTGELNSLARGSYTLQITATRTADSKQRIEQGRLNLVDAIT